MAKFAVGNTLPANGTLNPVSTSSLEPLRSITTSLSRTSSEVAILSGMFQFLPSSSSRPPGAR